MNFNRHSPLLRPAVHRIVLGMLVIGHLVSPARAQAEKVERDLVPDIEVTSPGDGRPILLRWLDSDDAASKLQVTTLTVPTLLENGLDLKENAEAALASTPLPPLERFWTLQGRMRSTEDSSKMRAQWRVLDGAARLYLIDRPGIPEARVEDADQETPVKSEVEAEPTKTDSTAATGSQVKSAATRSSTALERARAFARVQDDAISRSAGAAISQQFSGSGLVPTSIQIRLETASRRNMYEIERLTSILRLAEPLIPNQPVGIGAAWKSRWTNLEQGTPVETVMTWRLKSVDDAALEATGIAETAVLSVEYTRRVAEGLEEPVAPRVAALLESNGRGEVRIVMRNPMHLDARLIQAPVPREPARADATAVTRMRVITTE
jgi:hypothetical protein